MTIDRTQRRTMMLASITLALAVAIALLASIPASAGPGDAGPAVSSYGENPTAIGNMASGGGNLVPLW